MEEQCREEQVERIDLGDRRGRPDRAHRAQRECPGGGDRRPDTEPGRDERDRPERGAHEDGRQEVGPERDRPERHELGEPGDEDVRRVAGRVSDAQDVRHGLHLAPVAEGDSGQEGPEIDDERDGGDRGGERPLGTRGVSAVGCHSRMVFGRRWRAGNDLPDARTLHHVPGRS